MRIACIYWPTSSVGGINTELVHFTEEAERQGDTFHVLVSGSQKTKGTTVFPSPKLIRGGNTFITVHGHASHHPSRIQSTITWLEKNYDAIFFAYPCPHPTKAYGNEPHWLPLYSECKLPKVTRILDAYWDTYKEWGEMLIPFCNSIWVNQPAYANSITYLGDKIKLSRKPFSPAVSDTPRSKNPLLVWTSQWKGIKGIHKFLPVIPKVRADVELYSNGIMYYQKRTTPEWKAAIKTDHFKGYNGDGCADFYGYVPLEELPKILSRAWWMVDMQGHAARYEAYKSGSYNNTTVEALYYGALPILHTQVRKSPIPDEVIATVGSCEEIPDRVASSSGFAMDPARQKAARDWVLDFHDVSKIYKELKECLSE